MSTAKIASIYFVPVKAELSRPYPTSDLFIPAVPKGGKPAILEVKDHYQWEQQPFFKGTTISGKPTQLKITVDGAREIAPDLMKEWTTTQIGMTPECGPGMWIVREEIPLFDDTENGLVARMNADGRQETRIATESEKQEMWDEDRMNAELRQEAWIEYLISKADVEAENPKARPYLNPLAKIACKYSGRERDWLYALKDGDVKKCPYCTKSISAVAIKCPHCSEVVDEDRFAQRMAERERKLAAAKNAPPPPPSKPPQNPQRAA